MSMEHQNQSIQFYAALDRIDFSHTTHPSLPFYLILKTAVNLGKSYAILIERVAAKKLPYFCRLYSAHAWQGSCSHVGALLYWTETAQRIRDETTCTSKKNTWFMSTVVADVPYLKAMARSLYW